MMNRCPVCSTDVNENSLICPSCGAALTGTEPTMRQPPPKENSRILKNLHTNSAVSRNEPSFPAEILTSTLPLAFRTKAGDGAPTRAPLARKSMEDEALAA